MNDWRDARVYPRPWAGPKVFAWEFLRRNAEYIADWERFGWEPSDDDDARNQYYRMANKWGLDAFWDPSRGVGGQPLGIPGPYWLKDSARVSMPGAGSDHLTTEGRLRTGKVALSFDLKLPLAPQIKSATEFLRRLKQGWVRKHPRWSRKASARVGKSNRGAFVEMLRILDAESEGATPAEIIAVLWPGQHNDYPSYPLRRRFQTRLRTARAYCNRKYRQLPMEHTFDWPGAPKRKIKASA